MTTLTLQLPDHVAESLQAEAEARGMSLEAVALEALSDESLPHNDAFEQYLRDVIVPIADEMENDPSSGYTIEEMRDRLQQRPC